MSGFVVVISGLVVEVVVVLDVVVVDVVVVEAVVVVVVAVVVVVVTGSHTNPDFRIQPVRNRKCILGSL